MVGAIIGDIVGSIYEFNNIKTKEFEFFGKNCFFTDDTVMTIAVAKALVEWNRSESTELFKNKLIDIMHDYGNKYPDCGYGARFNEWIKNKSKIPYNSFGNGSAMRVSYVGWFADSMIEALNLAKITAEVTHNHYEGIKGAQAVAAAVFLARKKKTMKEIRSFITQNFYKINFTIDGIRDTYSFNETCQDTVPQALEAFFESNSFEDAIRNAVSIGGDTDTLCAITGAVAEAYYGVDEDTRETALSYLDNYLLDEYDYIMNFFDKLS